MTEKKSLFGDWKFYKSALALAVPIMLQQLIQSLVSLIDNFMVSGLGDVSMSGVNVAGQVMFVFIVFANTTCMAGGIFLTQYFGAKDKGGMQQAFMFKLIMGLIILIPYFMVCLIYPRQVLSLMVMGNTQAAVILDEGVKYIRIMSIIGPPFIGSVCIASSLRDMGKVKTPLVVTIIATLTNTVFNYLLIYGHLGLPALGVAGAAYATVISRTLEFLIFAGIYFKTRPEFAVKFTRDFMVDLKLFSQIMKKGAMMLFCEMTWVLSETITSAIYNGRGGADVVSGMASSFAIANLFFVAFSGIYSATSVIIGKTLGEGNLEEARQKKNWLLSGSFVFGCMMTLVGFATTLIIPIAFGRLSDNAIAISRSMVILMSFFMPVWVYMNAQQAVSRAGGDTKMGAYADASLTILIMLPMLFVLGRFTDIGPVQMYMTVKFLDIVKIVVFHIWMKKERWLHNLADENASFETAKAS
ncbi:MATE family efflux transporter [Butyrivibrio sp. CB08]|uniref:MATE family efflux transporter n=1 Tax=Butyrivibrio sp. CB08 TaxID=2364879 RepID=UPI000EA962C6|nr:MATE family efflux transporter [Butyrivibrio sp. CB08]RKM61258.1 MATE family efflux transporter [Butyrivibrio sp. CB08]